MPCEPGFIAIEDCSENRTRAKCDECNDGTFQPDCAVYNKTASCRNCTVCTVYKENCTRYQDAVCESTNDTQNNIGIKICFDFVRNTTYFFLML